MSEPSSGRSPLRLLIALAVMAAIFFVASKIRQGSSSSEEAEQALRLVLDRQVESWNQGDLRGFMEGYWQDKRLSFFSGGDVRTGWEETFERYRNSYQAEGKEMGSLEFRDVEVEVVSGNVGVVRGRWELTMKQGDKQGGLFTLVFKRMTQGWRIVHDHTSK